MLEEINKRNMFLNVDKKLIAEFIKGISIPFGKMVLALTEIFKIFILFLLKQIFCFSIVHILK